jgi:NAD(P)-dependent dehydrogenase (short-subunit alcohol dehydrogenase family)
MTTTPPPHTPHEHRTATGAGTASPTGAGSLDLADAVALVTGANKGIGHEVARELGERGATVLVGARDAERGRAAVDSLRHADVKARHVLLDVTDEASIDRAARLIEEEHGRLDILVNNAAIIGPVTAEDGETLPPSRTPVAALRQVYETNVFGVVAVTNALLPLLRRSPAGRIVNVTSDLGSITLNLRQGTPYWEFTSLPYPTSKTALNMVTAQYAKELWDTPIKVNAANPGYCATDLNGHSGFRTAAQGAEPIVELATVGPDGPSGTFYGYQWEDPEPVPPYVEQPW